MAELNRFSAAICLAPFLFCGPAFGRTIVEIDGTTSVRPYYLSEPEQDKITAVALKYMLERAECVPNNPNAEIYLSVRGEDPTPRLMSDIKGLGATFKPESTGPLLDRTISAHISINAFVPKGPATAVTNMFAKGRGGCGHGQIWVKKAKGRWSVVVIAEQVHF